VIITVRSQTKVEGGLLHCLPPSVTVAVARAASATVGHTLSLWWVVAYEYIDEPYTYSLAVFGFQFFVQYIFCATKYTTKPAVGHVNSTASYAIARPRLFLL